MAEDKEKIVTLYYVLDGEMHHVEIEESNVAKMKRSNPTISFTDEKDVAQADKTAHAEKLRKRAIRGKRAEEYPLLTDQLDAILKQYEADRTSGVELVPELSQVIDDWRAVKNNNPL